MLNEFLTENRADLIERCQAKIARRRAPQPTEAELEHGIPRLLEQLSRMLRAESTARGEGPEPVFSEIRNSAARHGRELLRHGLTVDQVVHDYGDVCQAITDLAFERHSPFEVDEFRTLNRCLDHAIADSVSEFTYRRDVLLEEAGFRTLNERLGFVANELRTLLQTASVAAAAIKAGNVGVAGATGAVLERSLIGLRSILDRSLADVRVTAGMPPRCRLLRLEELIQEVKVSAALEAQAQGCGFAVSAVEPGLAIVADREMLSSAIGNLLQNAFKFTEPNTDVALTIEATADRILIEVEDNCGGLPAGDAEKLSRSLAPHSNNGSGLGLGLSICRRSVEANSGVLRLRDRPGYGCVFTIELPRHSMDAA